MGARGRGCPVGGDLAALVNCAARTEVRELLAIEPEEWDDVMATNLRGPFLGIRAVGPHLRDRGAGRIVNIASDSAFRGRGVTGAHYAASKAGLLALTRRAAATLAASGVTVNAVAPGTIDGETVRELAGDGSTSSPPRSRPAGSGVRRRSPRSSLWLLSDDAAYVNGATLARRRRRCALSAEPLRGRQGAPQEARAGCRSVTAAMSASLQPRPLSAASSAG